MIKNVYRGAGSEPKPNESIQAKQKTLQTIFDKIWVVIINMYSFYFPFDSYLCHSPAWIAYAKLKQSEISN